MLKRLSLAVALSTTLMMVGCSKETEPAKSPDSKTEPAAENTFKLSLPTTATNIAKGGDEKVTIGVDRGENVKEEISLSFSPPEGITIEPDSATIGSDKSETEVTVKVDADAAAGEKSIPITGKAGDKETSGSFKVEVTE